MMMVGKSWSFLGIIAEGLRAGRRKKPRWARDERVVLVPLVYNMREKGG